jgi:NAD(P)-dependent dehydrogenase (short-subunit alcohol dehydrogenase family)
MDQASATLITGTSSGLGRASALRLSRERTLILHGRNLDRLEETRRQCHDPERHVLWPFDLKNIGNLSNSLVDLLSERTLSVEAFVHCAGMVTVLPARSIDYRIAQEIMTVNFLSAVEIINTLLKKKINPGGLSNIVFVSSIWARFGARGHSAYCASKSALDGFMRALAVELAPATRVNSILPGAIQTSMAGGGFADPVIVEKLRQDYPLGTGRADDIASAVEFVLSAGARWLTGQEIVIDGGRTINASLK